MDKSLWLFREQLNKPDFNSVEFDGIKNRIRQYNGVCTDVLNLALFGKKAAQWRTTNPDKKGNMRDYAEVSQLVCLSNLENLNALFIAEGLSQQERLKRLNKIAIHQMTLLAGYERKALPEEEEDKEKTH